MNVRLHICLNKNTEGRTFNRHGCLGVLRRVGGEGEKNRREGTHQRQHVPRVVGSEQFLRTLHRVTHVTHAGWTDLCEIPAFKSCLLRSLLSIS